MTGQEARDDERKPWDGSVPDDGRGPWSEARDDEREAPRRDPWVEAVNRALFQYDAGLLDVRGVAEMLARKHPEPEITDKTADRALGAWFNAPLNAGENIAVSARLLETNRSRMRAALEAALRTPAGEGEQQ